METNSLYARLELIDAETLQETTGTLVPVRPRWDGVKARLGRWGQGLVRGLTGTQEPQIVERRDPQGQTYFQVYDPVSQCRHRFTCEADLRTWLDQRYYT